jgi:hypothetical protein
MDFRTELLEGGRVSINSTLRWTDAKLWTLRFIWGLQGGKRNGMKVDRE